MFGLILALIYVAFDVLMTETGVVESVEGVLPFLWYWHMTFAVMKLCCWLIMPLIGTLLGLNGGSDDRWVGLTIVAISPLFLLLVSISSVLFLTSVYAVDAALNNGVVTNQGKLILGGIMYGLATMLQVKPSSNSSDS